MFRRLIQFGKYVLYLRVSGIVMAAMAAGMMITAKKKKEAIPMWFFILIFVVFFSLFLANTTIREVTNSLGGLGIYSDLR